MGWRKFHTTRFGANPVHLVSNYSLHFELLTWMIDKVSHVIQFASQMGNHASQISFWCWINVRCKLPIMHLFYYIWPFLISLLYLTFSEILLLFFLNGEILLLKYHKYCLLCVNDLCAIARMKWCDFSSSQFFFFWVTYYRKNLLCKIWLYSICEPFCPFVGVFFFFWVVWGVGGVDVWQWFFFSSPSLLDNGKQFSRGI